MLESAIQFWIDCFSRQHRPVRGATEGTLAEHVECPVRHANPAHAVVNPPGTEPLLRDLEAVAFLAEKCLSRDADVRVAHLRVITEFGPAGRWVLHRRDVSQDLDAWGIHRKNDHRRTSVTIGLRVGDAHQDREVGDRAIRREPLAAVYDVLVAVGLNTCCKLRWV